MHLKQHITATLEYRQFILCVCVCVLHFKPLTLTLLSNLPHLENTPQSLFPYTFF